MLIGFLRKWAWRPPVLAVALAVGSPEVASAGDGVREINQTCALAGTCFPGDVGGFPVSIPESGSYRLTSDLASSQSNVPIIQVGPGYVTIDLNGFGVHGPGGSDPNGGGIVGGSRVTVRNGSVVNASDDGIRLGAAARIEDVIVADSHRDGVFVQGDSVVRGVIATVNQRNGITVGAGSTVESCAASYNQADGISMVSGSLARSTATNNSGIGASLGPNAAYASNHFEANGGGDLAGGHASGGNICGDRGCTTDGRRRFYLSPTSTVTGGEATTACNNGFHMASLWELRDPSHLAFANDLAQLPSSLDLGQGPVSGTAGFGWIRTGSNTNSNTFPGAANCLGWISSAIDEFGSLAALDPDWSDAGPTDQSPWQASAVSCNASLKAWCVED